MIWDLIFCAFTHIDVPREVISCLKESDILISVIMHVTKQIQNDRVIKVFVWRRMLKVKDKNDFLFKETHQIHAKARKIFTSLGIDNIIIDVSLPTSNDCLARL